MKCSEFIESLELGHWVVASKWRRLSKTEILIMCDDGALFFTPVNKTWHWSHLTRYFIGPKNISGTALKIGVIKDDILRIAQLLS